MESRFNCFLPFVCLLLVAGPASAQEPPTSPWSQSNGNSLSDILSDDTIESLDITTGSALESIAIRPDIAFASQQLQRNADVRPWKQRVGVTAPAAFKQRDPAAVRRALVVGLQGATTCWRRAQLSGLRTSALAVQATFAANGSVERLHIHGASGPRSKQLQRCLDYVARRIRLAEPPGERIFVYTQVAFAAHVP